MVADRGWTARRGWREASADTDAECLALYALTIAQPDVISTPARIGVGGTVAECAGITPPLLAIDVQSHRSGRADRVIRRDFHLVTRVPEPCLVDLKAMPDRIEGQGAVTPATG